MIRRLAIFCAAGLLVLSACDLFSTREPEPPETRQSTWEPPLDAAQALINLQAAVYEHHLENFMACLVDPAYSERPFVFEPDPETASAYPGRFVGWSCEAESRVMQQAFSLVGQSGTASLKLTQEAEEHPSADLTLWSGQYRLELGHATEGLPMVFEGHVIWHLAPDSRGYWSIFQWRDNALAGESSWSALKAALGG